MEQVVAFVCPHGALKSRLAAAFFNRIAPPGWHATSAGLVPQESVSSAAAELVSGSDVESLLDRDPPRAAHRITADRWVGIDCDVAGASRWDLLSREPGEGMAAELRTAAERLARELANV